ncbi:hypothetical protein B1T34_00830 [Staphylococcus aureus]|nr:hypothetical protein B1T33_03875 [Staphylococcus aureus]PTY50262.1 hypothetical protein B1T34_00830 [Staphylococcus aureus]
MLGPRQLALLVEFFYEFLCVGGPSPTCTLLKSDFPSASVLDPVPNFHCLLKFGFQFLCVGAPPI